MFQAGQWQAHAEEWENINPSAAVLRWIKEGVRLPFVQVPEAFDLPNRQLSHKECVFVDNEIASLLQSGAIRHSTVKPVCISPVWCVPKKNKTFRLIVDLRQLNKCCPCPPFQYEGITTVLQSVQPQDHLVTIDLKNGYQHLSIHPDFHQYLGIRWRGRYYVYQVLPFGLAVSPYYFCKCIRQVIKYLRSIEVRISAYVDDFIQAAPPLDIVAERDLVVGVLAKLGFYINVGKSSLDPAPVKVHIGYKIDTVKEEGKVWISIPAPRIQRLRHDINRLLRKDCVSARALARVAGQCVAMSTAIIPAKLLLRNLYRLLRTRSSWQEILTIDQGTRCDLQWWTSALSFWNGAAAPTQQVDIQVTSDASSTAWGGHCGNSDAQGFWTPRVTHQSSNYRELLAIYMCQLTFLDTLKHKSVQFLTDNVTAVAYVNFQGGPSPELTQLARAIWATALENDMTICAKHLAGSQNGRADGLSRLSPIYEWRLHPRLWRYLDSIWGPHTIDRFASVATTQLPRYNSLYQDPLTEGVDALAQSNWNRENNYVACPFRLIPRVLEVIQHQRAEATILAPWWPSQPWFARLSRLATAPPIRIPNTFQSFKPLGALPEPLRNSRWRIYAWRVSGRIVSPN